MKKIGLEHSIRKILVEENPGNSIPKPNVPKASDFIGPNAGPLGFGVIPRGVPSIDNTKNLSPAKPEDMPVQAQSMQSGKDAPESEKANTSTSSTSSRRRNVQRESISLEHSIRNIVQETVGNLVGLNQSKPPKAVFNKPVQIEPPEGEEHGSIKAMNVSNQRKQAKQQDSMSRDSFAEEVLTERGKIPGAPVRERPKPEPEVTPGRRTPEPDIEVKPEVPVEVPAPFGPPKRVKTVPVEPEVPAPAKPAKPEVEPEVPARPARPAPVEPEVPTKPEKAPEVKPEEPTAPKREPAEKPSEKVDEKPSEKPSERVATKPETKGEVKPKKAELNPKKTETKPEVKPRTMIPLPFGSGINDDGVPKDATGTSVKTHVHAARARMLSDPSLAMAAVAKQILKKKAMKEETENKSSEERKKIEYVGRGKLDAKATLGRQSAFKTRVIDEEEIKPSKAAKIKSIVLDKKQTGLGENPIVEKEPRLKPLHMAEEGVVKKVLTHPATLGAGAGFGTGVSGLSAKIDDYVDPVAKKVAEKIPEPVKKTTIDVARKIRLNTSPERITPTTSEVSANLAKKQQNIADAEARQARTRDMETQFKAGKISAADLEKHYKDNPSMSGATQKMIKGAKTTIAGQAAEPEKTREQMVNAGTVAKFAGMAVNPVVAAPLFGAEVVGGLEKGRYTQAALDAATLGGRGKFGQAATGASIGHAYGDPFDPDEDIPKGASEPPKTGSNSSSSSTDIVPKKVKTIPLTNKD